MFSFANTGYLRRGDMDLNLRIRIVCKTLKEAFVMPPFTSNIEMHVVATCFNA